MAYDTDKIRADNPMSEVVARYTQVTTKGHESLALCPAHNDTTPSLNISNEKGFVKCFACGFGGCLFAGGGVGFLVAGVLAGTPVSGGVFAACLF